MRNISQVCPKLFKYDILVVPYYSLKVDIEVIVLLSQVCFWRFYKSSMISVAEAKDEEAVTLTVATYNLYNFPAQIHEEKAEKKCTVSYSNPSLSQNLICNFCIFSLFL